MAVIRSLILAFALGLLVHAAGAAGAADAPGAGASAATFATVGKTVISAADYQRALAVAMRKKYYHAKPPEGELAAFRRQVGEDVVNRVLLVAEAERRGIEPDRAQIDATVAGYERQYAGSANWQANRDKMLASVVPELERESRLARLERQVRSVPEPDEAASRAYYDAHRDLFVEPEQVKLAVIVLKVAPSSPQSAWNGALAEGRDLHRRLKAGADFAEMARLHSGDRSAADGGQMDYTHRGMLPQAVHGVVDQLKVGDLSEPVQLLEGIAIMRLEGRKPAVQRSFDHVRERAADLWQRDEGQARWDRLIAQLRRGANIRIDESLYAPARGTPEKARAS